MVAYTLSVSTRRLLGCHNRISACLNNVYRKKYSSYANILPGETVRVGCASGFWGDTAVSAPQLIHGGKIDFLVFDYLSEITMSLLTAVKRKTNGAGGFAPDFVQVAVAPYVKQIKSKGVKVISNAGGVNPVACAEALRAVCDAANIDLNIAVVTGDDLMPEISQLQKAGIAEMQSGAPFPSTVNSMNAYLGAGPIARALDLGADIVVTGRCVDSALVLAPLIHKFQWKFEDFDKLAQGRANIGFPIVECASDGKFVVTKPPKTGGLVSTATVSEQLMYEIGDPARYYLPDVVCDFTQVQLEEVKGQEGEAVLVTGAKGQPSTPDLKVSATYADGYRITAVSPVGGPRAKDKAQRTADEIIKRCRTIYKQLKIDDFTKVYTEILGSENNYGPRSNLPQGCREAVMWLAVHHKDKKALEILSREVAPAGTGMAPGLTGIVGGRPKVSPVLKLFSFLHKKDNMKVDIHMNGKLAETFIPAEVSTMEYKPTPTTTVESSNLAKGSNSYRLEDLAYTRSGDKGNHANIGVVARHPALLPYIRQAVTEEAVMEYFSHFLDGDDGPEGKRVQRYEVPGIHALNFMLYNVLGGGGIASLRSDPQGKAYGQMLLDFVIQDMPDIGDLTK